MCCVFHFSDPHDEDKVMVDGVMKLVAPQQHSSVFYFSGDIDTGQRTTR